MNQPSAEHWLDAILNLAAHYRLPCSRESLRVSASWQADHNTQAAQQLAQQAGLAWRDLPADINRVSELQLPVLAVLEHGQLAVVNARTREGDYRVQLSGDQGLETSLSAATLSAQLQTLVLLRPLHSVPDSRVDNYVKPFARDWLRDLVLRDWRPYGHIMLASLITNLLALVGILFSMQVYDRVVPAQSYPTLYVLFGGVMLATLFAFLLRQARNRVTDVLGKGGDLRISDRVFGHALRVRNSARPQATGSFISQIRELEPVREMMTSTTVAAVADLPFFLLFCVLFAWIAGGLVWVPVAAVVLMLLPGLLAQKKLRAMAQLAMREASLRNAMLVETVQGLEDIKVLQAEPRFQNQWNYYNAINADACLQLRELVNTLGNWSQTVQAAVFAVVICIGAPMVMAGEMTTGVLVAASILSSRMLAPLASVAQLLNRWQQAKLGRDALDELLKLPLDNPVHAKRIHLPTIRGEFELREAAFGYGEQPHALTVNKLVIRPGERIALLGRNGAGKSTLLQALSGLLEARSGRVLLDGVNMPHIDPADVRRRIALLSQNARLFYGSLRENLLLGAPQATDQALISALQASGAWDFIRHHPEGLDYGVQEGGLGLSGGQRQSLLLARLLVREPNVLLLDEPTAALDDQTEQQVIARLAQLPRTHTFIIATHRTAVLPLVDRILVIDKGRIMLDDTRDAVLARLRGDKPAGGAA